MEEIFWRATRSCFFETFSNRIDLVNQTLYADGTIFTKRWGNQCVLWQGNLLHGWFCQNHTCKSIHSPTSGLGPPRATYGSTILSMSTEALLSLTKVPVRIWSRQRSYNTHILNLWAHPTDSSDPDDKCCCGLLQVCRSCQLFLPSSPFKAPFCISSYITCGNA